MLATLYLWGTVIRWGGQEILDREGEVGGGADRELGDTVEGERTLQLLIVNLLRPGCSGDQFQLVFFDLISPRAS